VGGEVATTMAKLMKKSSTLVTYGAMTMEPVAAPAPLFIFKDLRLVGFWLSGSGIKSKEDGRKLVDRVQELIKGKHITADCVEVPLAEWQQAFDEGLKRKVMFVMNK
jgi:mitochondrial enoyl-[acyl-carrier protein] reductase / trans-2-enoyl-CoA reductase